jgi:hypothetical protein
MKKCLTSLFLFFALAAGIVAGTPVFSGGAENGMSAMECCKRKAKDCDGAKTVSAARLCCAVNCNNPAPNAPGAAFNFSPSGLVIRDSILKQIALLLVREKPAQTAISFPFERKIFSPEHQPKYIQNQSFLI